MAKTKRPKRTKEPTEQHLRFELLHSLSLLKGVVEHNDGGRYFGSLLGYTPWETKTQALGLVRPSANPRKVEPTELGQRVYDKYLKELPQKGRAYMWDWPKGIFTQVHEEIQKG